MRFSLQQMVQQTLAEATEREKLAAAEDAAAKQEKEPGPSEKTEQTKVAEVTKTSAVFVERLASAVEYLNTEYLPKFAESGPQQNLLPNNEGSPTPGKQNYQTGQASHDQPPQHPGKDPKSPGNTTPATSLETTIHDPPGGGENWKNKDILKQSSVERVKVIMAKMAGEDTSPAHIQAAHQDVPPAATKSEEGVPKLPGPAAKQEAMIDSLKAAINYTKQQAKAEPKRQMGEVIDEPAQKKSTDPVLHNNLDATGQAGVKISSAEKYAAARALLTKVAEEGGDKAAKLQALMKAKKDGKHEDKEKGDHEREKEAELPLGGGY